MKTKWLRGKLSERRKALSQEQAGLVQEIARLKVESGAGTRGAKNKLLRCQRRLREIKRQFFVLDSNSRAWNMMTWKGK